MATASARTFEFDGWNNLLLVMIAKRPNLKPTTVRNYRNRLGEFCRWLDEQGVRPEDLTSDEQVRYVREFIDGPKAHTKERTRLGIILLAHRFFVFAAGKIVGLSQYRVLPEPPEWKTTDEELVDVPQDDAFCLSRETFQAVIDKAAREDDKRLLAMHLVMGTAGLRRAEACRLTWGNVIFDDPRFEVGFRVVLGKGNKTRRTGSLDPRCRQALAALRLASGEFGADDVPVFIGTWNGRRFGHLQPASMGAIYIRLSEDLTEERTSKSLGYSSGKITKRLLKDAKPENEVEPVRVTCHSLRHRCARDWHETYGLPVMTVSKLLGHSSVKTTERYLKSTEEDALDTMGRSRGTVTLPALPAAKTRGQLPKAVGTLAF